MIAKVYWVLPLPVAAAATFIWAESNPLPHVFAWKLSLGVNLSWYAEVICIEV